MLNWRRDITVLRGLAVLFVVWYHAGWPGAASGYLGVDAFFVISGYLITSLLCRELQEHGRVRLGEFWARRVKRLLPASSLVIISVLILSRYALEPLRAVQTGRDALPAGTFWSNIYFWMQDGDYFKAGLFESPLRHYWSLSLEEQYYVFLPLLLTLSWRFWGRRGVIGSMVVSCVASFIYALTAEPNSSFYLLQARVWQLGAGGLLAILSTNNSGAGFTFLKHRLENVKFKAFGVLWLSGFVGLAVVVGFGFGSKIAERVAVVVSVLVMLAVGSFIKIPRVSYLLEWLGSVSYSLYLWHWPLLIMSARMSGKTENELLSDALNTQVPAVVLALLLSFLTHRYVESLRWSNIFSAKRRTYVVGMSMVAVVISIGLVTQTQSVQSQQVAKDVTTSLGTKPVVAPDAVKLTDAPIRPGVFLLPDGTPEIQDPVLAADKGAVRPPEGEPSYIPMPDCFSESGKVCSTWGENSDKVLMIGETEGWQWPFYYVASKYGFKAETIRECVDPGSVYAWRTACDAWLNEKLSKNTPIIISLIDDSLMERWIEKLGGESDKIAFISSVRNQESETCLKITETYEGCNDVNQVRAKVRSSVKYFDTDAWLCGSVCPSSIDRNPVSRGKTVAPETAMKLTDKIREVVESVSSDSVSLVSWNMPEAPTEAALELNQASLGGPITGAIASRLDSIRNEQSLIDSCMVGMPENDRCINNLDPGKPVVLIVGDSHAGQWAEAIDLEVKALGGQSVVTIGCKAMMQTEDTYNGTPTCRGFEQRLQDFINTYKPRLIIASSKIPEFGVATYRTRGGVNGWVSRQHQFWEKMAPGTKGVIIIADNPLPRVDVPLCLSDNQNDSLKCGAARMDSELFYLKNAENKMAIRLAASTGVPFSYIDMANFICAKTYCPSNTNSLVIYRDNNHLAREWVEHIKGPLVAEIYRMYKS